MPLSVIVADDHDIIREGIKSVLKSSPDYQIVCEARDGEEAFQRVEELKPDILLVDISMPKISGLDIISRVKYISPQTKVLVITVHKLGAYVAKAMRSGADGYLTKEHVVDELLPALLEVRNGKKYLGSALSGYMSEEFLAKNDTAKTRDLTLNNRELDVLRLVVEGKTSKEIAEVLFLSRRTVENYKNSMLKKLNLHKSNELITYALEHKLFEGIK